MILECLKEAKEDHDGIQRIYAALASSITEQNEILKDIQNNTKLVGERIKKTCKEK